MENRFVLNLIRDLLNGEDNMTDLIGITCIFYSGFMAQYFFLGAKGYTSRVGSALSALMAGGAGSYLLLFMP